KKTPFEVSLSTTSMQRGPRERRPGKGEPAAPFTGRGRPHAVASRRRFAPLLGGAQVLEVALALEGGEGDLGVAADVLVVRRQLPGGLDDAGAGGEVAAGEVGVRLVEPDAELGAAPGARELDVDEPPVDGFFEARGVRLGASVSLDGL